MVFLVWPAAAVKPEPNSPGYLTDGHGAQGVIHVLLETRERYPHYDEYIRGTFQWLYDVRMERDGAYFWRMSASAPKGHPSYRERIDVSLRMMDLISRYDPELKDPLCRRLYEGSAKAVSMKLREEETKSGQGVWAEIRPNQSKYFAGLGHSHGQGAVLTLTASVHAGTGNADMKCFAIGAANLVKDHAVIGVDENGRPTATWLLPPPNEGEWRKTRWRTGWCYGAAGVVGGLLDFHAAFPEHRFHDGTSALDLAAAGLNWIITKHVVAGNGWNFENMRSDGPSENPGFGSGVSGIGHAFLTGYENYKETDPELAQIYLDAAKKAATYVVELHEFSWDYHGKVHRVQNGGFEYMNLGLCGTVGGEGRFLIPMATAVADTDPAFAERCTNGANSVADWFKDGAVPLNDGVCWHARPKFGGENTVNFAIDYGLTGMVIAVDQLAVGLDDPELAELTQKALKGMISLAVEEGDGYKWPLFTPAKDVR